MSPENKKALKLARSVCGSLLKGRVLLAVFGLMLTAIAIQLPAEDHLPDLTLMVEPLQEVEAMLADGTFSNGEFSPAISEKAAGVFARKVKQKLRMAKAEYTRLPRAIRGLKEADEQWYRMEALFNTSDGFSKALQRHARMLAERRRAAVASPKGSAAATSVAANTQTPDKAATQRAAERKQAAEARAAAVRAQQEAIRARAAAVKAEKKAAAQAKAAGVEPSGPDWHNSYIPNIQELQSSDGFFLIAPMHPTSRNWRSWYIRSASGLPDTWRERESWNVMQKTVT
jgi:hypothetical protein